MTINKEPVYLQICSVLKSLIEEGKYKGGDRFLTEREVSQKFDVSRTTANKSLSSLVGEGILIYKKGVGTFVSAPSKETGCDLRKFFSKQNNIKTEIKVFCERPFGEIPELIQNKFMSKKNIYYIMTLYMIDDIPFLISRKYINIEDDVDSGETILNEINSQFSTVNKELSLSRLKKNDAHLLGRNEGEPAFLIQEILERNETKVYDVSLLVADNVNFTMNHEGYMDITWDSK